MRIGQIYTLLYQTCMLLTYLNRFLFSKNYFSHKYFFVSMHPSGMINVQQAWFSFEEITLSFTQPWPVSYQKLQYWHLNGTVSKSANHKMKKTCFPNVLWIISPWDVDFFAQVFLTSNKSKWKIFPWFLR